MPYIFPWAQAGEGGAASGVDHKRLAEVVSRCGALASERPKPAFNTKVCGPPH